MRDRLARRVLAALLVFLLTLAPSLSAAGSEQPYQPSTPRPEVQELKPPPELPPPPPTYDPYYPPYEDPYYPPDEEPVPPPPELPPLPRKVVTVQFCVVDDGRMFGRHPSKARVSNPGDPDARFGVVPFLLIPNLWLGLLVKNALYARAGVSFAVAGPTVFIADPHPNIGPGFTEGGELGDVVEPGDDLRWIYPDIPSMLAIAGPAPSAAIRPVGAARPKGKAQWAAVRRACLAAVRQKTGKRLAAGTLLEIVIRRFVLGQDNDLDATGRPKPDGKLDEDTEIDGIDQDGDGDDGEDFIERSSLLGISPRPKCSREPPDLMRTPTVIDPEQLGIISFGFVLAHENGHALCLDDAAGPPQRLMSPRVPPFTPGFTAGEIQRLRAQAQHLSGTRDKDGEGGLIERRGPVTRYELDPVQDSDDPAVDLFGAGAAKREDGSLGLLVELADLIPVHADVTYTVSVDVDAAPVTGVAAAAGHGPALPGTDLQVEVQVTPGPGGLQTKATVRVVHAGRLHAVEVPDLEVKLAKVHLPRGSGQPIPIQHSLFVVVPEAALPVPLAEGFTVLAEASRGAGAGYDRVPLVVGSVTPDRRGPLLTLEPPRAPANAEVVAHGRGFSPGGLVAVYAGVVLLGTATADEHGAFAARFTVPVPSVETGQPLTGGAVMPLTAMEAGSGSDVALLIVPSDSHPDS